MSRKLKLYFIRHGTTDWNREHRVMGAGPVPLNGEGREMVRELAREMAGDDIPLVYTSTVVRAMETAEILAEEWGAELIEESRLNESAFEEWIGKNYHDLRSDPDFKLYLEAPTRSKFSRDEGMRDIQDRILAAVERIKSELYAATGSGQGDKSASCGRNQQFPDRAAVVSHRDVIKPALVHFLGMDLDDMHRLSVSNASVSLVETGGRLGDRVSCLNYTPRRR